MTCINPPCPGPASSGLIFHPTTLLLLLGFSGSFAPWGLSPGSSLSWNALLQVSVWLFLSLRSQLKCHLSRGVFPGYSVYNFAPGHTQVILRVHLTLTIYFIVLASRECMCNERENISMSLQSLLLRPGPVTELVSVCQAKAITHLLGGGPRREHSWDQARGWR